MDSSVHGLAAVALALAFLPPFATPGVGGPGDAGVHPEGPPPPSTAVADDVGERPAETIGTIEATLDGEARLWYVVSGETDGKRQPGALWMEVGEGERMGVVGGYDTEDVDFSSIEMQGGFPVSLGSYQGSMISIGFPIPEGDATGSWTLPGSEASVTYLADANAMDFADALILAEGVVETTRIETDGTCRFEGRFSGTLRSMDGAEAPLQPTADGVELTDGSFEVEGCERIDPT